MRIIEDLSDFPSDLRTVVTSGTFDGVHLGHQKILRQVAEHAKSKDLKSVVLTYWPHPRFVLHQDDDSLKLLSTFPEKAQLIDECGIDYLVRIPFTKEFSGMEPERFVGHVLVEKLNAVCMVIGYDHHFGKDRKGDFKYLEERAAQFGFGVKEISRHDIDDVGVSSTKIRNFLNDGNVREAANLLGRAYNIHGLVVHGDKKGTQIGFPTANVWVPEGYKLIPAFGSYATFVEYKGKAYGSMTNIGIRPTMEGKSRRIEVNIFNFDQRLYGEELTIHFVQRLRDEIRFESVEDLVDQLKQDKIQTQNILENESI